MNKADRPSADDLRLAADELICSPLRSDRTLKVICWLEGLADDIEARERAEAAR